MKKVLQFGFSIIAYLIAFASLVAWILSTTNLVTQISIDGPPQLPFWAAAAKDLFLIGLFGAHHSITARKPFKAWLTRFLPVSMERSLYVLISGLLLSNLVIGWEPLGGSVWSITPESPWFLVLYGLSFLGWVTLFVSTFLINHFDLFGLRQTYVELIGKPYTKLNFREVSLYKYVRHPIYLGVLMGLWFTPVMSYTHLLLAVSSTAYVFIGIMYEERDLTSEFGSNYRYYQLRVPRLLPFTKANPRKSEAWNNGE